MVHLNEVVAHAVNEIATRALQSEFAKHADTAIANVYDSVVKKVHAEVTRFFGPHSQHDIIGVATQRVLDTFKQRYVYVTNQSVASIICSIHMHKSIDVSELVKSFVHKNPAFGEFSEKDLLFIKRTLLRQVALRFVDENRAKLREKNPQADCYVIINDLLSAFKRIVNYGDLERCVQLDVENALKERVRQTFNSTQNLASASNKAVPTVPNSSTTGAAVVGMFAGSARAALAAPPAQPDNRATYYR